MFPIKSTINRYRIIDRGLLILGTILLMLVSKPCTVQAEELGEEPTLASSFIAKSELESISEEHVQQTSDEVTEYSEQQQEEVYTVTEEHHSDTFESVEHQTEQIQTELEQLSASPVKTGVVLEGSNTYLYHSGTKQYDTVYTNGNAKFYFETSGVLSRQKWSYSNKTATWYYSDANGEIIKEAALAHYVERGKQLYDIVVNINQDRYYYEPHYWGGVQSRNKWAYGVQDGLWYYTDTTGRIRKEANDKYYRHDGVQQSDTVLDINGTRYYYEPQHWGSVQSRNKWAYGVKDATWYYTDTTGRIRKEANRHYYKHDGVQQSDTVLDINGTRYYYEPQHWGSVQSRNKWAYGVKDATWYYTDTTGRIRKEANRHYYKHDGVQQSDTVLDINGTRYYYEPQHWGSVQSRNKWAYGVKDATWYYTDATGRIRKEANRHYYKHDGVQQSDTVLDINGTHYYYEPAAWGSIQARSKWSYGVQDATWYETNSQGHIIQRSKISPFVREPKKETVTEIRKEVVPFGTDNLDDPQLDKGKVRIEAGHLGEDTLTYEITKVDGVVTQTRLVSRQRTKAPVNKKVYTGTKDVITERTYTRDEVIPIPTEVEGLQDEHLPVGQTRNEAGVAGLERVTYRVVTTNGVESAPEVVMRQVLKSAVAPKLYTGTKLLITPTATIEAIETNEVNRTIVASYRFDDADHAISSATAQVFAGNNLVKSVVIPQLQTRFTIDGLQYNTNYTLKTLLTYNIGNGETNTLQTSQKDFEIAYKKIEIKDIDTLELYGKSGDDYRRYLTLDATPVNTSEYFVKVKSDRFKEMLLPVSSIAPSVQNGKETFKVTVTMDELVQDNGVNGYQNNFSFHVAKRETAPNTYSSFQTLINAIKANLGGTFTISADMSADEVALNGTERSYISEVFTGTLIGAHRNQASAIYNLKLPLFREINNATIRQLDFKDVEIKSNASVVGTVSRHAINSRLEDVSVEGTVVGLNNVGGLVGEANNTSFTNTSFAGSVIATQRDNTASRVGGLVGRLTGNQAVITRSRVDATINLHAISNNQRAGSLVGLADHGARVLNSHAKGTVSNSGTGATNAGQVGGVIGSIWSSGNVSNIISEVNVLNGQRVNGDVGHVNASISSVYVLDTALGKQDKWENLIPESEAKRRVATLNITTTLDDSSRISRGYQYDVNYLSVANARPNMAIAYYNIEKLMPFYNKDLIVKYGNHVSIDDKLNRVKLLDVVPLINDTIVADIYTNKAQINRIMLHYSDDTIDYKNVVYQRDFANNRISEYHIDGMRLIYTPEAFLSNYSDIIGRVKSSLSNIAFNSEAIVTALGITDNTAKKLDALFLEESFNKVKLKLDSQLRKVLTMDKSINTSGGVISNYIVKQIENNKANLLLGLAYLNRWYNINYDAINTQDLTTYKFDFFGNAAAPTLDNIINVGQLGYDKLLPKNNVSTYQQALAPAKGKSDLFSYLEAYRHLFLPTQTNSQWLKNNSKAYIVEAKSEIEEIRRLQDTSTGSSKYAIGVYDKITNPSWEYRNMILPLLTLPEKGVFIISTMSTLSFGMYDRYEYNAPLNRDFNTYVEELVSRASEWQRDHFDFWYRILKAESKEKLFQSILNYDGFDVRKRGQAHNLTWKTLEDKEISAIRNFFGPVGKWYDGNPNFGAYATGTLTHFVADRMLDTYGSSVFTHEMVHNFDGNIYFEGAGRRQGLGAELYALGFFQTPATLESPTLGINTMFTALSGQVNANNRYHSANPERFRNAEELQNYAKRMFDVLYIMDYLEGTSVLKQSNDVKRQWFRQIGNYHVTDKLGKRTHAGNTITPLTTQQIAALNLRTIDDLIEHNIINRREYWHETVSPEESQISGKTSLNRNGYYVVSLFSPIYAALDNPNGAPGDVMFRRMAYELLAEKGYHDGLLPYASNQLNAEAKLAGEVTIETWPRDHETGLVTDTRVFNKIFNGQYIDWKAFKKDMFKQRVDKADRLKEVTIHYQGRNVTITSFAQMQQMMDDAVQWDIANDGIDKNFRSRVRELKGLIYNAYLRQTNDFETSIFN